MKIINLVAIFLIVFLFSCSASKVTKQTEKAKDAIHREESKATPAK